MVLETGGIDNITNNSGKTVYVRVSGSGSVGNVTGDVSIIREGDDINADFENESVADGQTIPYEIANLEQLRSLANRVEAARVNSESRPYADCFYRYREPFICRCIQWKWSQDYRCHEYG